MIGGHAGIVHGGNREADDGAADLGRKAAANLRGHGKAQAEAGDRDHQRNRGHQRIETRPAL